MDIETRTRPSRHDGTHGDDCFGCRIKSIQFSSSCTPSRTPSQTPPASPHNNWEKGIVKDERGLPVRRGGKVIGLKEYADNKRSIDQEIRAVKQGVL